MIVGILVITRICRAAIGRGIGGGQGYPDTYPDNLSRYPFCIIDREETRHDQETTTLSDATYGCSC